MEPSARQTTTSSYSGHSVGTVTTLRDTAPMAEPSAPVAAQVRSADPPGLLKAGMAPTAWGSANEVPAPAAHDRGWSRVVLVVAGSDTDTSRAPGWEATQARATARWPGDAGQRLSKPLS